MGSSSYTKCEPPPQRQPLPERNHEKPAGHGLSMRLLHSVPSGQKYPAGQQKAPPGQKTALEPTEDADVRARDVHKMVDTDAVMEVLNVPLDNQWGVGVKGGTEAAVHALRLALCQQPPPLH